MALSTGKFNAKKISLIILHDRRAMMNRYYRYYYIVRKPQIHLYYFLLPDNSMRDIGLKTRNAL